MKLYKKLVLALGVAFIVASPLIAMLPTLTEHAAAANIGTFQFNSSFTQINQKVNGSTLVYVQQPSSGSKVFANQACTITVPTINKGGTSSGTLTCPASPNYVVSIAAPGSNPSASIATGIWLDHSHIKATINGSTETFTDGQIDQSSMRFTNTSASCSGTDTITNFPAGGNQPTNANATVDLYYSRSAGTTGNSTCRDYSGGIKLSDPNNAFDVYLVWQDGGTIVASDGKSAQFNASGSGSTFLVQSGNAFKPGTSCQSYLIPSSNKSTGQMVLQFSDTGVGPDVGTGFSGWPSAFSNAERSLKLSNGCYTSAAFTVKLGDVSNSKISPGSGGSTNDTGSIDLKCSGFSINPAVLIGQILTLKWVLCPLINGFQATAGELDNGIMDMLCVNEQQVFSPKAQSTCSNSAKVISSTSTGYKNAWNVFRLIALGLLAIAALVMIVAQTSGMDSVDAYTIRKVLPRLLVAAIGISLSWQLMEFFVGLSNILGVGIRGLIYAPFVHAGINTAVVGGGTNAILFLTSLGGLAFLGPLGILSFVATGLLAIVIAFFVLVLRNLLIVILLVTAPVAIVAYILPNTEKYWKIWWEWFSKALMVFPIITAFIAVGHVFAAIATAQASTQGDVTSIVSQTAGFIAYFAPYFLIPTAFRFAGGALGTIGGFVNDRNRGAFDRLRKFRGNRAATNAHAMKNFSRFSENNKPGQVLNTAIGAAANPMSMLRGRRGVMARKQALQTVQGQENIKNSAVWQANQFDDNFHLAVANRGLAQHKLDTARSKYDQAVATYGADSDEAIKAQADVNAREHGLEAAMQMPFQVRNTRATKMAALDALTKTGYQFEAGEEGYQELDSTVRSIVGDDARARAQLMDSSQFNLKGAGRPDLGGINHGGANNMKLGIRKLNNYQRGSAKTPTYHAGAQAWLGTNIHDANGDRKSDAQLVSDISASVASGTTSLSDIAEWQSMMAHDYAGANDANKIEIDKQMGAISQLAEQINQGPVPASEQDLADRTRFVSSIRDSQRLKDRTLSLDPSERDKI